MKKTKPPRTAATQVVIDRLDERLATIVIRGQTHTLPRSLLPAGTKEGDALRVSIARDDEATDKLKREIGTRLGRLRENDGDGDESL
ncbi:MAG: DUF3006 domain-containing protein [Deltaproteobacteria bacterium]|nr:DUF3006 domain-containing protein [Deltaproteobacteria bacterium]